MVIIKLDVKQDKLDGGGILTLLEKIGEGHYNALAITALNQECFNRLNEIKGEYVPKHGIPIVIRPETLEVKNEDEE